MSNANSSQFTGREADGVELFFYRGRYSGGGAKNVGGASNTNLLYDGVNLVQEIVGGTPTANLLTSGDLDQTFARTDTGGTTILLSDALRSVLALADASGAVQTQYTFDPFGKTTSSGTFAGNTLQFTGRENDYSGLYSYRARYYDPAQQRFISEDPLGLAGGANIFAYAENAPTIYTDPLGLKPSAGFGRPGSGRSGPGGNGEPEGDTPGGSPQPNDDPPRCSGAFGGGPGAVSGTVIADPFGFGIGLAISIAYVPGTGEIFIAPGVGASLGHNFSFGPMMGPNPSGEVGIEQPISC